MPSTPLAIFAYRRPEHLTQTLRSLEQCGRIDECKLYVFCDGPKDNEDMLAVAATRDVAKAWARHTKAEVIERDTNLGLAHSIVNGVTDLCTAYGRVIVVEDDLVLSPGFVSYMLQALERYDDCPQVYQVSGYMFPIRYRARTDAFFLPLTTTWGWATWARAWKIFDWKATGATDALQDRRTRWRFDLDGSYPYTAMLEQRLGGDNDSWGILWWWAVFKANGLGLHPRQSFVYNGGFDGSGTHCQLNSVFLSMHERQWSRFVFSEDLCLPTFLKVDYAAFKKIKAYLYRTRITQESSFMQNLQNSIKHFYRIIVKDVS